MLQQRKKDYLIRLLEELMKSIHKLVDKREKLSPAEREGILNDAFTFFVTNFEVTESDTIDDLSEKIPDVELLEQYARLLMIRSDESDTLNTPDLKRALQIVEYLEAADKTYSWDKVVLREDILHRLDSSNQVNSI
ncbi:hypothetical protein M2451_001060 [Dysgonomonas sp. PFB1-18]|uniref:hypothetical protein n=1 Tax=unclassified Dysgonomonas TaxID=2630389 RepID=UPI0024734B7F|nr:MULTISPECIES: hypothetical protein [unclassified Dysgonomonas]MDH6308316.1 hypothetical protein [Dysgonomonas sp. PF1-14]MDH6338246.1 hypothetical protein [Dysgonomonas sp. PF1-16]MDH6379743.1 hypothetical protein [Dysgonomonas sp. PFB1-18]MDH6397167.1 hypothetical protein [Dysgonomonas sp. PF1-23]